MHNFNERVRKHAEHVANVGQHCGTEETTKQALILPLLDILGFSPFDPTRVKAEYHADFPGVRASERVDYALFCHSVPVMFIEAKAWNENLSNHAPQLARYFNATPEVAVAAITNGHEWRFFTDLTAKNVMDAEPFLTVDFGSLDDSQVSRLYHFRHDEFQPDALRTLAEESIYLNAFTNVIGESLREPDTEFARYVATRANIQRQFNAKFLDSLIPLVKQAVSRAVSEMVVSGLSAKPAPAETIREDTEESQAPTLDPKADQIDSDNPRIITTYTERRLLEIVHGITGLEKEITGKDTETYYNILYQNKTNRWLLRYYGNKKQPTAHFCVPLTDARKAEIARAGLVQGTGDAVILQRPEDLLRLSGIVFDALTFCQDDNNFKHKDKGSSLS
jgi:hypothetical protein